MGEDVMILTAVKIGKPAMIINCLVWIDWVRYGS